MTDMNEIAVRARTHIQLFNSLDPSPFREKDLDADVEAFVVDWARELPKGSSFKIVVRIAAAPVEIRAT